MKVDLLIRQQEMLVPIEIKSAETFLLEFLKGNEHFRRLVPTGRIAAGLMLFAGELSHEARAVRVLNPSLHDDWLGPWHLGFGPLASSQKPIK